MRKGKMRKNVIMVKQEKVKKMQDVRRVIMVD